MKNQRPAYLIYFTETKTIKRVRCVKFTDFYNNLLPEPGEDKQNVLSDEINNTYEKKT